VRESIWLLAMCLWLVKTVMLSLDSVIVNSILPITIDFFVILLLLMSPKLLRGLIGSKLSLFLFFVNLFLLLSTLVALLNGFSVSNSAVIWLKWFTVQCLFLLGVVSSNLTRIRKLFPFIVLLSALVHLIAGVLAPYLGLGQEEIDGVIRYSGLAGKINILANFALFFAIYLYVIFDKNKSLTVLALFLFTVIAVFVTGTVKNALILLLIILYIVFLKSENKKILMPVIVVFVLPLVFYIFTETAISQRIEEFKDSGVNVEVAHGEEVGNSLNWRILHWKFLFDDWYGKYKLQGTGIGHYDKLNGLKTKGGVTFDPHNDWFKFLLELGIIGFLFFCAFMFLIHRELVVLSGVNLSANALLYAFYSCLIAMLAANVIYSLSFFYFFWIYFGFAWHEVHGRLHFGNRVKERGSAFFI